MKAILKILHDRYKNSKKIIVLLIEMKIIM